MLKICINTKDYGDTSYYTRIKLTDNANVDRKLSYVKWFSGNTRNENTLKELIPKLEPDSTGDNTDLSHVNIHSKLSQVGYGMLNPELQGEIYPQVDEIDGDVASITLKFCITTKDENRNYNYEVTEFFRINQVSEKVTYVYSYDRFMNQIFEPEYGISSGRNIYLGINEDKSLQTMCNSTGTVTAFVVNGNLWSYHPNRDKFNKVFSFDEETSDGFSEESSNYVDKSLLNVKDILEFANTVDIDDVRAVLKRQIDMNSAIADEGLMHPYGAQIGRTLLQVYGDDVKIRAKARAAAGSDARMGGCSLPVVINSGSGNQGMTVSLPVIEFAKSLFCTEEQLYRALVVSNLVAIHQKKYIGSLSAYCGAVSAACGSGAAITYLYGGNYEDISATIVNTIGNVGGIVCDGAKSSCAAKIASAVDAAILGHFLGRKHHWFQPGEGIVQKDVEGTIKSMGYIGRVGMKDTDKQILNIMIDQVKVD